MDSVGLLVSCMIDTQKKSTLQKISRDMIEDYLVYIKTDTGLTSVSYTTELSVLDNLLDEIGRELEIGNMNSLRMIRVVLLL